MEGRHTISRSELGHVGSDRLDDSRNIVALIDRRAEEFWEFPVFTVFVRVMHSNPLIRNES